jgi:hypothetical protein
LANSTFINSTDCRFSPFQTTETIYKVSSDGQIIKPIGYILTLIFLNFFLHTLILAMSHFCRLPGSLLLDTLLLVKQASEAL